MIFPSLFNQKGFGLLGMVFMILTLSVAAVTTLTVINPSWLTRKNQDTISKATILRAAIESYRFSHGGIAGTYPPTLDDLLANDGTPCAMDNTPTHTTYLFLQGWCGPYVDQIFLLRSSDFKTDSWGTAFQYDAGTGVLTSCGADKNCGGADDLVFNP